MKKELHEGQRVESLRHPFKGIRGTVSHKSGRRYIIMLDQVIGGRTVLRWPAKRFKVLSQ